MAADHRNQRDDVLRLNAMVDGELSAAGRAELAVRLAADRDLARAHATLAGLKAQVLANAEGEAVPPLLAAPRSRLPARLAAAAAIVATIGISFTAIAFWPSKNADAEFPRTIVRLAALPSNPVAPDLAGAGLKLTGIAVERPGGVAVVVSSYQGPRGCRLELRAYQAGLAVPAAGGTSRSAWTVDDLAYELTAYGMPAERFAAVAAAAEFATRNGGSEDSRKLREASIGSRPCTG